MEIPDYETFVLGMNKIMQAQESVNVSMLKVISELTEKVELLEAKIERSNQLSDLN